LAGAGVTSLRGYHRRRPYDIPVDPGDGG
jgi:hypothetical protein